MPQTDHFHLTIKESGATAYLRPAGEFDLAAVGSVENALDRVFGGLKTRRVVFDLRRLTFIDSAGLKTILRANDRARAGDVELVVVRPVGTANRVFTLTRAGKQLNLIAESG